MYEPSVDYQAGFNSGNTEPFDETKSEEWKKGWRDNKALRDDGIADLTSFKIPNRILKKIGYLTRESYDRRKGDLEDLSQSDWTLIEEIITGFENR